MTFLLMIWVFSLLTTIITAYLTLQHLESSEPDCTAFDSVTIIKPLKGRDDGLLYSLCQFFELDYPGKYELIFSVADENDPAVYIVRCLLAMYPHVDARLVLSDLDLVGPNPKINNMIRAYEAAEYDFILISDSNVRVPQDYIQQMMRSWQPGVGVVTSIVSGFRGVGLGGILESIYLGTFFARGMIFCKALGVPCVMGKSMLFKKSAFEKEGGLISLAPYLAEDYMAGQLVKRAGLKTVVSPEPVAQLIGNHSLIDFWKRHVRWGRIRLYHEPVAFFMECSMSAFVCACLGAVSLHSLGEFSFEKSFLFTVYVWACCDFWVFTRIWSMTPGEHSVLRLLFEFSIGWCMREILAPVLWFCTLLGNTVEWRGRKYVLSRGGTIKEV